MCFLQGLRSTRCLHAAARRVSPAAALNNGPNGPNGKHHVAPSSSFALASIRVAQRASPVAPNPRGSQSFRTSTPLAAFGGSGGKPSAAKVKAAARAAALADEGTLEKGATQDAGPFQVLFQLNFSLAACSYSVLYSV